MSQKLWAEARPHLVSSVDTATSADQFALPSPTVFLKEVIRHHEMQNTSYYYLIRPFVQSRDRIACKLVSTTFPAKRITLIRQRSTHCVECRELLLYDNKPWRLIYTRVRKSSIVIRTDDRTTSPLIGHALSTPLGKPEFHTR